MNIHADLTDATSPCQDLAADRRWARNSRLKRVCTAHRAALVLNEPESGINLAKSVQAQLQNAHVPVYILGHMQTDCCLLVEVTLCVLWQGWIGMAVLAPVLWQTLKHVLSMPICPGPTYQEWPLRSAGRADAAGCFIPRYRCHRLRLTSPRAAIGCLLEDSGPGLCRVLFFSQLQLVFIM